MRSRVKRGNRIVSTHPLFYLSGSVNQKVEPEPFTRVDSDCPVQALDDGPADCQSQAGPLFKLVYFDEAFEYAFTVIFRNTNSGVLYAYAQVTQFLSCL